MSFLRIMAMVIFGLSAASAQELAYSDHLSFDEAKQWSGAANYSQTQLSEEEPGDPEPIMEGSLGPDMLAFMEEGVINVKPRFVNDQLQLEWQAVFAQQKLAYQVYRSESEGNWDLIAQFPSKDKLPSAVTFYELTDTDSERVPGFGAPVQYRVQAVNAEKEIVANSATIKVFKQ